MLTQNTGCDISFFNNSPYSWGCFRCWNPGKACPNAFPTHVGVFLLGQLREKEIGMVQLLVNIAAQVIANLILRILDFIT